MCRNPDLDHGTNNTARLILREKVDFVRHQHDQAGFKPRADSCFVLVGTHQHGVENLNSASSSASRAQINRNNRQGDSRKGGSENKAK